MRKQQILKRRRKTLAVEGGLSQTIKGKLHLLENLSNKQTAIHKQAFSNQITPIRQRTGNIFGGNRKSQLPSQLSPLNTAEGIRLNSADASLDETMTTAELSVETGQATLMTAATAPPLTDRHRLNERMFSMKPSVNEQVSEEKIKTLRAMMLTQSPVSN